MPRGDKILFKFTGDGSQNHHGIPLRDILESDKESLTDADFVTLSKSPLYAARNDAPSEVGDAEQRIERADDTPALPEVAVVPEPDAPKAPTGKGAKAP